MTPSGVLNAYGVVASGAGVRLHRVTPTVTTDSLYNVGGSLYFNGSALASAGASAEATYASGQATSLNVASGVANYASGQAIENEGNITALLAASGQGVYASGQSIENEGNITALLAASGQAVYASGNTVNITFCSNAESDFLYHNRTNFLRLSKGTDKHVLPMNGNSPNRGASLGGNFLGASRSGVFSFGVGYPQTKVKFTPMIVGFLVRGGFPFWKNHPIFPFGSNFVCQFAF
jgi:hypothetical protein